MKQSNKDKAGCNGGTFMKPIKFISTGVLLLLLGITAPIYANQQQDQDKQQQDKDKKQPDQNKQQDKGKQQQDQNRQQQKAQQQQQDQNKQQQRVQQQQQDQNRQQQQQKAQQQQQVQNRQQQRAQQQQQDQNRQQQQQALNRQQQQRAQQQQSAWQERRAQNWQSEHQTWQQRGGYNGDRISEDRYRGNFGPDHSFRIYRNPVVVAGGYPGFLYGGVYFSVVDPWPQYWSNNWYENDDVYIDYSGDGYYMYNRRYPEDRISIGVYLNFVQPGDRRGVWLKYRSSSWRSEHRTWQQRGGYNGYRIPDDRYGRYFGQSHRFRINSLPLVIVGGYPRFQYGGFWFSFVDPWPEYWSNNWYENDDMYIDYSEDGYYLYNRRYPQDRISISVFVN
jgi:hypothetical protein